MVMGPQDFFSTLKAIAHGGDAHATLYRTVDGDQPQRTGATVIFGERGGERFMEVHGLEGEIPAAVRLVEDDVYVGSPLSPEAWELVRGRDAEALRIFWLLDPRCLVDHLQLLDITASTSWQTFAIGHVNLREWKPQLPRELTDWLRADAYERPIGFYIEKDRLVQTTQPDLYPRRSDRIIERFE